MKRFLLLFTGFLTSVCLLSGCLAVMVGAGVAGGIVVMQDKVRLQYDTSYEHAWEVAHETISKMGIISSKDDKSGRIEAMVDASIVNARIVPVNSKSMQIEIKARKNFLPNMDLAVKIINEINSKLQASS